MSRTWMIGIAVASAILLGYVGSYCVLRTAEYDAGISSFEIRDTLCLLDEGELITRFDTTGPSMQAQAADRSTRGYYLSYLFEPLWRLEARLQLYRAGDP